MARKTKKPKTRASRGGYKKPLGLFVLGELFANRVINYRKELILVLMAEVLLGAGLIILAPWKTASVAGDIAEDDSTRIVARNLLSEYNQVRKAVGAVEDSQTSNGLKVVNDADAQRMVTTVSIDLGRLNYVKARHDLATLKTSADDWSKKLATAIDQKRQAAAAATAASSSARSSTVSSSYLQVPILLYHYTPGDFESQLVALRDKGYTAIDMDQLNAAMSSHGGLPQKPVVITFDDGFANQMQAFTLLEKYQMKATFYIITGGDASNWCIGAGRKYDLPSQPAGGCGDAYLDWNQVRQLDRSGLITIASHTVDHENLAAESADRQWFEINEGKQELESQIGHEVHHFAYPYGGYNTTTIELVKKAGFTTAVTTLPGIYQPEGGQYVLRRERSAYTLP